MSLINGLALDDLHLPSTRTGQSFVLMLALLASINFSHSVGLGSLKEQAPAFRLGTTEVIHRVMAVGAGDFLPEIGFFEDDGLRWVLAVGTHVEGPENVATVFVADVSGEGPACDAVDLGGSLAFGAKDLVCALHT